MYTELLKPSKVTLYGHANSPEAYAIRDFLSRSVVEYDWIEIINDQDCKKLLGIDAMHDIKFPIVQLTNGERLFAPSLNEIAKRLGWISQPNYKEYDLSIYGAGPAGLSAAVYAASEGLRTILIERHAIGGQAGTSSLIENYMGFPNGISGATLAERARQQAIKFGVEILLLREGINATFINNNIHVNMADGSTLTARTNICATGVEYLKLNLPNEEKFLNKGVYYGAGSSEAPMCVNENIYIVGGGNSAGQAAINFSAYARQVSLIVRGESLAASLSYYLIKRIQETRNINVIFNSTVTSIAGDDFLEEIEIRNTKDNSIRRVKLNKLFICIGGIPNTDWAVDTEIIRDNKGYLVTGSDLYKNSKYRSNWPLNREPYFLETSVPGSFAAGDVRHNSVKRVASAVGEGAMAVTFVHKYLQESI